MIKSIWKPHYHKSKPIFYIKIDEKYLDSKKGTTSYKIIWTCDSLTCKTPNKLHSINACHLIKDKLNFNIQTCRNCQCTGAGNGRFGDNRKWSDFHSEERVKELKLIYSEKFKGNKNPSLLDSVKIKKNQNIINETFLKKIIEEKGFKLVSILELGGKKSKLLVECPNGHLSNKRYSNFMAKYKKFICSSCFYDSIKSDLSDEDFLLFVNYVKKVRLLTKITYRKYKNIINPNNYKIGKNLYHIDYKYSIYACFKNGVPIEILAAKENLQPILASENLSKQTKCSITKNELYEMTNYLE